MIRVSSARFHLGVQLNADVKTGLSEKVNGAVMFLDPLKGLFITAINKKELVEPIFVPLGMLNMAYMYKDSFAEYLTLPATAKEASTRVKVEKKA